MYQDFFKDIEITHKFHFTGLICAACGIPFMIESSHERKLRDTHQTFYCPNGHSQWFAGKTSQQIKEELEQKIRNAENEKARIQNLLTDTRTKLYAETSEKNKLAKKLKRVHNGSCPCCKRHFINLERHIKTKHPELLNNQK